MPAAAWRKKRPIEVLAEGEGLGGTFTLRQDDPVPKGDTQHEPLAILRRNGWKTPADLQAAAGRSKTIGDTEMSNDVRWIRTYVMAEPDGTLGTVCIYEATSPEAIQKHASRADLALSEIRQVVDTVVVRPDPVKG